MGEVEHGGPVVEMTSRSVVEMTSSSAVEMTDLEGFYGQPGSYRTMSIDAWPGMSAEDHGHIDDDDDSPMPVWRDGGAQAHRRPRPHPHLQPDGHDDDDGTMDGSMPEPLWRDGGARGDAGMASGSGSAPTSPPPLKRQVAVVRW